MVTRTLRAWLRAEMLEDRAVPATATGLFSTIGTLAAGTPSQSLRVIFEATPGEAIDTATLGSNDLTVSGPGYSQPASFLGFSMPNGDPSLVLANYSIPANTLGGPGWDRPDNGEYSVSLLPNAVTCNGEVIAPGTVGTFRVDIGQDYLVTTNADSGPGSLRGLLALAKTDTAMDTIRFDTTFFATKKTIALQSELAIDSDVIIVGPTAQVVLDQTLTGTRALTVSDGDITRITAILSNLAIVGSGGSFVSGGGLLVGEADAVELTHCDISGNTGSAGGGIHVSQNGSLTLRQTSVSGNSAGSAGGGIYFFNNGALAVHDSSITGNTSSGTAGGGGLYFFGAADPGKLRIVNSTVSNNTSLVGGGIALRSGTDTTALELFNSTVTANSSSSGGGVARPSGSGMVTLLSTILSGNAAAEDSDLALTGVTTLAASYSVIGTGAGTDWETAYTGSGTNLAFASELRLQALAINGVSGTKSHALGPASAAREKGSNPLGLTLDQTGGPRVQIAGSGVIDIGSFERIPGQPVATLGALPSVTLPGSAPTTFTVTYADDAAISKATIGDAADIVVTRLGGGFSATATFVSVTPNTDASTLTATYTIMPPGGTWDGTDNGKYGIDLLLNAVKNITGTAVDAGPIGSFVVGVPTNFTVINANDSGPGSLRDAITRANLSASVADTVSFDSVFFAVPRQIKLTSQIAVTDALSVSGPGPGALTIIAAANSRIFQIDSPEAVDVRFSGLTLSGGNVVGNGGAILLDNERLTLQNCVLDANTASLDGGAIALTDVGSVTLLGTTLRNNRAEDGGAISMTGAGRLIVQQSTLSGNSASADGGGIYFFTGGSLLLDRSTLSGNTASGSLGGGGLYFFGTVNTDDVRIVNSTLSGNSAIAGGAMLFRSLFTVPGEKDIVIANSTLTQNISGSGAVAITSGTGAVRVVSSIISGNTAPYDLFGEITAEASAIGVAGPGFIDAGDNLAAGFDLQLSPLALNGGATATHLPGLGSAALGKGSNEDSFATDQRGLPRADGLVDIGAVEVQLSGPPAVTGFTVNDGLEQRSRLTTITLQFAGPASAVSLEATGAVTLTRTGLPTDGSGTLGTTVKTGAAGANGLIVVTQGSATTLVLTFRNADFTDVSEGVEYGSLSDGRWRLTVPSTAYQSAADETSLRRLFGDGNNDGTVEGGADFSAFGSAFGTSPGVGVSPFDFNNDGTLEGGTDFANFGARFGVTI